MVCRLGRPWATGLGAKPAKTRILARFFAAEGQASEYGGRLPSDCAADMRLPQVASLHRVWLTPLASASIKQLKTRIPERFLHRGGPREMRGKEPRCRRSLATEMASGEGVGGMEGRKTVQNSSSGALLPRGIYLNRRGPKTGMPIGSTLIPPLPVSTLPRRRSTAPLASRGWPRPEQKHAPRSTFGEFSSPRASTTCLIA